MLFLGTEFVESYCDPGYSHRDLQKRRYGDTQSPHFLYLLFLTGYWRPPKCPIYLGRLGSDLIFVIVNTHIT